MQRRVLYVLMFALPAFLAAGFVALLSFGAVAGVLWLFVFGDRQWPAAANMTLVVASCTAFVVVSAALLGLAWSAGRRQETRARLNPLHPAAAGGATVLMVLAAVSYQWKVGNIGPKSHGLACAEFCQARSFAGSGMPPTNSGDTTCSCYDAQGHAALSVPIATAIAEGRR